MGFYLILNYTLNNNMLIINDENTLNDNFNLHFSSYNLDN